MKTIKVYFSFVALVILTIVIANLKPPLPTASAQSARVEAPQETEIAETSIIPSSNENVAVEPETKASEAIQAPAPVVEVHVPTTQAEIMAAAGVAVTDYDIALNVLGQESGFCATRWEGEHGSCPAYHGVPTYGGYGLCQSTPGIKMASMGEGWETDPVKQMQWCNQYAMGYGGWAAAKEFKYCLGSCYSTRTKTTVYKVTPWF